MHDEDEPSGEALALPQFGMRRFQWSDGSVEFHLPHGELIALLRPLRLHGQGAARAPGARGRDVAPHVRDAGMGAPLALRGDLGRPPRRLPGAGIGRRLTVVVGSAALVAALAAAGPAVGADPGRWRLAQADSVPLSYFQGLTHSAAGSWFFDGITVGLFRTDRGLVQKAETQRADGGPHGPGLQPHRRPRRGTRARAGACCSRSSATSPVSPTAATPAGAARSASPTPPR